MRWLNRAGGSVGVRRRIQMVPSYSQVSDELSLVAPPNITSRLRPASYAMAALVRRAGANGEILRQTGTSTRQLELQPSPDKPGRPSSHCSPKRKSTNPLPQVSFDAQLAAQPSRSLILPSSHASPISTLLLPQIGNRHAAPSHIPLPRFSTKQPPPIAIPSHAATAAKEAQPVATQTLSAAQSSSPQWVLLGSIHAVAPQSQSSSKHCTRASPRFPKHAMAGMFA